MTGTTSTSASEGEPGDAVVPEEGWAAAIAAWPPLSKGQGNGGPARGPLMTFRERTLERAYLQFEYERSKMIIVVGLAIGTIIMIGFLWIDPRIIPAEYVGVRTSIRLWVNIPCALIGLIGSIAIKDVRVWIPLVSILNLIGGLSCSALIVITDGALYQTATMGVWNIIVVTFFICGLPFIWAATVCLAFGAVFTVCSLAVHTPAGQFTSFAMNFLMVFLFSAFATYRYERATRQQFVAQGMSQILAARQLAAEADRRKWLEVIAAFLRHELNNAITAISSSVDLAERAVEQAKLAKFLGRARRSTLYMRRLLAQVADATSLESALVQRTFECVSLTDLLHDRVADFQEDHGSDGLTIEAEIAEAVHVRGDADALTQMLDKLFNNAREHGTPGLPLRIELRRSGEICTLAVSDQGDPLPDDVEQLFRPFVSNKARRTRADNLGLGLFVARTIASHHGGSLTAEPLDDGLTGARFTVRLPLAFD